MPPDTKLPELILADGSPADSSRLSRLQKQGKIRKIVRKVYTSNLDDPLESIVKRYCHQIAGHICPNGIISHRSAFHGGLPDEGVLTITENSNRTIELPGLVLKIAKGPSPSPDDPKHIGNLSMSSFPRLLLENLQQTRDKGGIRKTVQPTEIEEKLDRICSINGEQELNRLRDEAKQTSRALGMEKEFERLDSLIGSLLGTRTSKNLSSVSAIARSRGNPYDTTRIDLFDTLCHELIRSDVSSTKDPIQDSDKGAIRNQAFFESYFSNYIEGTKFILSEAQDIVFKRIPYTSKPQDSHDVLATFELAESSRLHPSTHASSPEDFIANLKKVHTKLMAARPEVEPGKFKLQRNQAGATQFVDPELVPGTLAQAYERSAQLIDPLAKAIFLMFAISEVHPFNDGNGRSARLAMNAELSNTKQSRIIIPTQRRTDYIQALKAMSQGKPGPLVAFLVRSQKETSEIDFTHIETATAQYSSKNAFDEYSEGFSIG